MQSSSKGVKKYFLLLLVCFSTSFAEEKLVTSPSILEKHSITIQKIKYKINNKTYRALKNFDQLQLINRRSNDRYLILIGSKRSNPKNPMGFCGAGLEHSLILLSKKKHSSTHEDTLLLASCLTNNAPIDIEEQDISQLFYLDSKNNKLRIRPSNKKSAAVHIKNNKLQLTVQQSTN